MELVAASCFSLGTLLIIDVVCNIEISAVYSFWLQHCKFVITCADSKFFFLTKRLKNFFLFEKQKTQELNYSHDCIKLIILSNFDRSKPYILRLESLRKKNVVLSSLLKYIIRSRRYRLKNSQKKKKFNININIMYIS